MSFWTMPTPALMRPAIIAPPAYAWSNLAALFSGGTDGIMIDLTNKDTLFQDANGAAAVVNNGDPIGLALDQHGWGGKTLAQMRATQPELVTNGDFAANISGWTNQNATYGNISWQAGTIRYNCVHASVNAGFYQAITTVAGRWYEYSLDLVERSNPGVGNSMRMLAGTSAGGSQLASVAISDTYETKRIFFKATTTTSYIYVYCQSGVGAYSRWDNFSVKEIDGNHAYQNSDTTRPVWTSATGDVQFNGASQFLRTDFYFRDKGNYMAAWLTFGAAGAVRNFMGAAASSASEFAQMGVSTSGEINGMPGGSTAISRSGSVANSTITALLDQRTADGQLIVNGGAPDTLSTPGDMPDAARGYSLYIGTRNLNGSPSGYHNGRIKRILAGQIRVQDTMTAADFHANLIAA